MDDFFILDISPSGTVKTADPDGTDWISSGGVATVEINLSFKIDGVQAAHCLWNNVNTYDIYGIIDNVQGSKGPDTVLGNQADNLIYGDREKFEADPPNVGGADRLAGAGGNDTIFGGVGNDTVTGGVGNDDLNGGLGDDLINGGAGQDLLEGGSGKDTFVFDAKLKSNVDSLADFDVKQDVIHLRSAVFQGLREGKLSASAFVSNKTGLAEDRSDHVIYDSKHGELLFDEDGAGHHRAVEFATIDKGLHLTAADFFIV